MGDMRSAMLDHQNISYLHQMYQQKSNQNRSNISDKKISAFDSIIGGFY